jgi:Tol biopolymer transport system component
VGSYTLPVEGGRPQPIVTGTGNALWPFWSRDGRWIYFATKQPDGIWKIPSAGGAAIRLTKEGAYPQESSDGKRIFYVVGESNVELWSAASSGGDAHREKGMPTLVNSFSWAPVPNGISFIDGSPSHLAVKYFDFSTRQAQLVSELQRISFLCCGIALSETHDTLFFSGLDNVESDIMLAENFR